MCKLFPMLLLNIFILSLAGCATVSESQSNQPLSRKTIAVMPLDNQTNSVVGALYMREEMLNLLEQKGYAPLSISQTDQQLANQLGISLGGQIAPEDIPKITAALGVEAVMTGRLRNFESVLMSYNQVAANFAMYDANNSQMVWEYDNAVSVPFSPLRNENISTQMLSGLLGSVLDRTAGKPLHGAVMEYYQRLQYHLPSGWYRH